MDWSDLFFSAEGRIGQKPYWLGVLVLSLLGALLHLIPVVGAAIWLVSIYCWICVVSKRLHDLGYSGWVQVAPWVVSLVFLVLGGVTFLGAILGPMAGFAQGQLGLGLGVMIGGAGAALMLLLLSATVNLIFLLWLGLTPGEAGPNRYGSGLATLGERSAA